MKDYNHNGRIDSEDELLLQEMVKDNRVDIFKIKLQRRSNVFTVAAFVIQLNDFRGKCSA